MTARTEKVARTESHPFLRRCSAPGTMEILQLESNSRKGDMPCTPPLQRRSFDSETHLAIRSGRRDDSVHWTLYLVSKNPERNEKRKMKKKKI